jgi:chromate reductase, NAD(P)H dehydrogenase (quinone)
VFKSILHLFMRVIIISTSPRAGSSSLKVAKNLQNQLEAQGANAEIVDMHLSDIPMVGRGALNVAQLTDFQENLVNAWAQADLVFMTLPEYNWTNGGEFVNMIHQLGNKNFAHLFHQKTFSLVGVSAGRGGRLPALDAAVLLNKIISFTGQFSIVSPKIHEAHEVPVNLDAQGNSLGNEVFDNTMRVFVEYSLRTARQWKAGAMIQV